MDGFVEEIFDGGYRRSAVNKEALGWKDLAVPAAGLALMTPMMNSPAAQAAPGQGQGQQAPITQQMQAPQAVAPSAQQQQDAAQRKPAAHQIVQVVREITGMPNVGVRYLTPAQAHQMNVPNAMVDAVVQNGVMRPASYMFLPQGLWQALDSLTQDTGVVWPEQTQAIAIMTLTHESYHLKGGKTWQNESYAQIFAFQTFLKAANLLGVAPDKAARLQQLAAEYAKTLPADYQNKRQVTPAGDVLVCAL